MARSHKNSEHIEAAEKLLDSIFTYTPKTRQEISAESGLSLMTVGKTVDMLSEAGLLMTAKAPTDSPGRKPSATYPDPDYYYIIIDITKPPESIYVYDVTFSERTRITIPKGYEYKSGCNRDDYINDLLMEFAGEFNYFKCIGAGLLLKDTESGRDPVFAEEEAGFAMSPFSVSITTRCSAVKNILRIREVLTDNLTYYVDMQSPRFGVLFAGTDYFTGTTGVTGDISSLYDTENASPEKIAEILSDMRILLRFDSVVIGSDGNRQALQLEKALEVSIPDLTVKCLKEKVTIPHLGILYRIRRGYMEKISNRN